MEAVVELEMKQKLAQLSDADRRSMSAYLLHLRQGTQVSTQERSELMDEMDKGQKTRLTDLNL